VADCTNLVGTKGYCGKHWLRLKRNGSVNKVQHLAKYADDATCLMDKCDKKPIAKNLCKKHYVVESIKNKGLCQELGCKNKIVAKKLCSTHYMKSRSINNTKCKVDKCKKNVWVKKHGMCNQHYVMFKKHGDPLAGAYRMPFKKALDHGDGTRTCTQCMEKLPISSFHKDKQASDGIRSTCKKCRISTTQKWYWKDVSKRRKVANDRRIKDPEKARKDDLERYGRDREKRIALATEHSHLRKARKKKTKTERGISKLALKKKFGTKCYYCGKEMDFSVGKGRVFNRDMATIEHLIPLARGGEHTFVNTVLACRFCNISKNAKSEVEFEEYKNPNTK
jgi:hypothetical protein